jgi:hypothetical protein
MDQLFLMTNSPLAVNIFKKSIWIYTFTLLIAPLGYIIKIKLTSELSVIQIGMLYGMFSLAILLQNLNDF